MTFQSMSRPDPQPADPNHEEPSLAEESVTPQSPTDVTLLAKMLAAVGGGAVSPGLALDLVLNEVVEQARHATGASGAAIALSRDGQMICRATTGNAPDLGVRIGKETGISGACLITGNVQLCSDTDVDPRVDAEACRRLHVRSMLMVAICDQEQNFGLLEVFAAQPNAFSEADVKTLQVLAQRIADSKRASEEVSQAEVAPKQSVALPTEAARVSSEEGENSVTEREAEHSASESEILAEEDSNRHDVLSSVLVLAVITVAVLLGVVIGVGFNGKTVVRRPLTRNVVAGRKDTPERTAGNPPQAAVVTDSESPANSVATQVPSNAPAPAAPPSGGLIVTQNGKVIYRSDTQETNPASAGEPQKPSERLIRRINPIYPEAARTQHIEGPVVLNARVLGDGSVSEIEIVSGHPLLAEAATQAVRQWKFQPYSVNGQPIEREERITVRFSLPPS